MSSFWRLCGFIVYVIACLAVLVIMTLAVVESEGEQTARYTTQQQQETLREQARQATERVQAQEWGATMRVWAWPTAAAAVLVVIAVQAGRSHRHAQSEQTRRRALLVWYAQHHLPDARVEIGQYRGELALIDHDSGEIIPYDVAQLEVGGHRLLTD